MASADPCFRDVRRRWLRPHLQFRLRQRSGRRDRRRRGPRFHFILHCHCGIRSRRSRGVRLLGSRDVELVDEHDVKRNVRRGVDDGRINDELVGHVERNLRGGHLERGDGLVVIRGDEFELDQREFVLQRVLSRE